MDIVVATILLIAIGLFILFVSNGRLLYPLPPEDDQATWQMMAHSEADRPDGVGIFNAYIGRREYAAISKPANKHPKRRNISNPQASFRKARSTYRR